MKIPQVSPARIERLITEGYEPALMSAFRRAWALTMRYKWAFLGFWSVYLLLGVVLNVVPLIAQLASLLIAPLVGGAFIWAYYLMHCGRWRDFGNFFDVVQRDLWWRLLKVYLWMYLMLLLVFSPSLFALDRVGFWDWYLSLRHAVSRQEFPEYDWAAFFGSHVPWLIALNMIPFVYLLVSYTFAFHHALFVPEYSAWLCLEKSRQLITRRWFDFFGYIVAIVLLMVVGGWVVILLMSLVEQVLPPFIALILLLALGFMYMLFLILAVTSLQGGWAVAFFRLTGLDEQDALAEGRGPVETDQLV